MELRGKVWDEGRLNEFEKQVLKGQKWDGRDQKWDGRDHV